MSNLLHDVSWVVPYRTEFLTGVFETLTWLGYPTFVMVLLPLGYWLWRRDSFTRIAVLVILSTVLNAYLKDFFQNPRPDAIYHLDPGVGNSFGMPSGHTQIAVVLWFGLAYEIQKKWAWIIAAILVLGISFSRIYLGIHDLEDVLAGFTIGVLSLCLYRYLLRPRLLYLRNRPLWVYLLLLLALQLVAHFTWPAPAHTLIALSLLAFLIAWLVGDHINTLHIEFKVRNVTWAAALVVILGVAGLSFLTSSLKPMLVNMNDTSAAYVNTFCIGLYMTLIAPAIFKLFRLGKI